MVRIGFLVGVIGLIGTGSVSSQTAIQRGEYLVNGVMACGNCHTPPSPTGPVMEKFLAGGLTFDTPGFKVTASNITPDRGTGIGAWTADDIKRSIIEGKRPNGVHLAMMPVEFFKVLTSSDVAAITAYVQSVKPISNKVPDPEYRRPIDHDLYTPATSQFSDADMQDKIKRGLYLSTIGHCMDVILPGSTGSRISQTIWAGGDGSFLVRGANLWLPTLRRAIQLVWAAGRMTKSSALSLKASRRMAAA